MKSLREGMGGDEKKAEAEDEEYAEEAVPAKAMEAAEEADTQNPAPQRKRVKTAVSR